jgi:hypothetical protein
MFIHEGKSLWSTAEKQTELGFSWEANVLGHALQQTIVDGRFHHKIYAIKVREISTLAECAQVVKHLKKAQRLTSRHAMLMETIANGKSSTPSTSGVLMSVTTHRGL